VSPAPVVLGLDHVQLAMPPGGEQAARDFYVRLFGLAEVIKPPELAARGGIWLIGQGVHLHLGVDDDFRPATKAHLALVVADLGGVRAKLAGAGVAVAEDDTRLRVARLYVTDPFGNRIELVDERDRGFTDRQAGAERP
jgi:catechol 2,3-dioxygenase-like lactoylglutathione lyase family enzyme